MNYIYVTNNMIDVPKVVDVNGTQKLECKINCVSGIQGDTYGFYKNDAITLYTDVNLTIVQVQESIRQQCVDYVKQNYPDK